MTTADRATLRALIDGERPLLDGLHSGEEHRYYYGAETATRVQAWAQGDYRRGFRPHHYPALIRLRDHAITTRSPFTRWGQEYPREFWWSPPDPTFDTWADAQTLTRTRTETGRRLLQRIRYFADHWEHGTEYTSGVDHAVSLATVMLALPDEQARTYEASYQVSAGHAFYPADGFTHDWTDRLGPLAPLAWTARIPLAEITADPGRYTERGLRLLAALRGYRLPLDT